MAEIKHPERYGPYLTSNSAPAPFSAFSSQNEYAAFRAFSENLDDDISFSELATGKEQYAAIALDKAIRIWGFKIYCRTSITNKDSGQVPYNFKLQGRTDSGEWEDVYTNTSASPDLFAQWDAGINKYSWSTPKMIEVNSSGEYLYYRILCAECQTLLRGAVTATNANNIKLTLLDLFQVEGVANEVERVEFDKTAIALKKTHTETITATIYPPEATIKTLIWTSSDTSVARVVDGVVTGVKVGIAMIAAAANNGITATCMVTVTDILIESITIEPAEVTIERGSTGNYEVYTPTVTILPDDYTEGIDYIEPDYWVARWNDPKFIIYADDLGKSTLRLEPKTRKTPSASIAVTVVPLFCSSIEPTETNVKMQIDTSRTLIYTVLPTNAYTKTYTLESSNEAVVTVEGTIAKSVGLGTAVITATTTDGNATATVNVEVTEEIKYRLADLLNTTTNMSIFRDNIKNDDGTDNLAGVDWFQFNGIQTSSIYVNGNSWIGFGESVAHLKVCSRDGATYYLYRQEGTLKSGLKFLKIRWEGFSNYSSTSDSYSIKCELFLFSNNDMFLNAIQTPTNSSYLGTSALIVNGVTTALDILISSKPTISFMCVDGTGSSFDAKYRVYYADSVEGVDISQSAAELIYPATLQLTASLIPITASGTIIWDSSNKDVATVDSGLVSSAAFGTTVVSAKVSSGQAATCVITVLDTRISQLEIESLPEKRVYRYGESLDTSGMIVKAVRYDGVVEYVTNYAISGYSATVIGTQEITLSYGGKKVTFSVEVQNYLTGIRVSSLPLKQVYLLGEQFDSTGLLVYLVYANGVENKSTSYTLTGFDSVSVGVKVITVSEYGFQATFTVEVFEMDPNIIIVKFLDLDGNLLKTELVQKGNNATPPETPALEGYTFTGWDNPYMGVTENTTCTAMYKIRTYNVTWKDYDGSTLKIESVYYENDATPPEEPKRTGYVFTGWNKGYSNITENTIITAQYTEYIAVTGIQVNNATIKNGQLIPLMYSVLPIGATNKTVGFSSSNKSVATIGIDGVMQANRVGTTTIKIISYDNKEIMATCTIKVEEDSEVNSVWLSPQDMYLQIGKSGKLTVSIISGNDANTSVNWSSSNKSVATVDSKGAVKAIAEGVTTITVRLKSNASMYAKAAVEVMKNEDFLREIYAQDSVHKELVIHSVNGKFEDITNTEIVEESMTIKEAVCTSAPISLGGCICNSFEILVSAKRFWSNPPSGEIQIYQRVSGRKINLFNGIIDSAQRQENKMTRKLVAYDKMYTMGDVSVASWFKSLSFPITVGNLRKQLFKKIGIACQFVTLTCDEYIVNQHYIYYEKGEGETQPEDTAKRHELYSVPDTLKASDVIRDMCEIAGMWGWMNRSGTFNFIRPGSEDEKTIYPIEIWDDERHYQVKAVEIYMDDKAVDPFTKSTGPYNRKQKYHMDDSNFIISATRGTHVSKTNYNIFQSDILTQVLDVLKDKQWVSFNCKQRFDPTIQIGTEVYYKNKKLLADGTTYTWAMRSAVLERTIQGVQCMTETLSAAVGPFSVVKKKKADSKEKKNEKAISDVKKEVSSLGESYYGSGGSLKAESVAELPSSTDDNTIFFIQEGV